jgi:hypothetical protein
MPTAQVHRAQVHRAGAMAPMITEALPAPALEKVTRKLLKVRAGSWDFHSALCARSA